MLGKLADLEMRIEGSTNRLVHNGIADGHQLEAPPGVIPRGSSATVRSCRPYPFLPTDMEELRRALAECEEFQALTALIRSGRRNGLFAEAAEAHKTLVALFKAGDKPKNVKIVSSQPSSREVAFATKFWDGPAEGFGDKSIVMHAGDICEIHRRTDEGWVLVVTADGRRGWCSPHVLN